MKAPAGSGQQVDLIDARDRRNADEKGENAPNSQASGQSASQAGPAGPETRVQWQRVDLRQRDPAQIGRLGLGDQLHVDGQVGQDGGVAPSVPVVVLDLVADPDRRGGDAGLLVRLSQRSLNDALVAVPGTSRHTPGVTVSRPRGAVLQQDPWLPGTATVHQQ